MVVILHSNIKQTAKSVMILIVSVLDSSQIRFKPKPDSSIDVYVEDKQVENFLIKRFNNISSAIGHNYIIRL